CFIFFHFFFDWSLKRTLTWTGTKVYGAEIDITSVKTSFLSGSIRVRGIQVTDKQNPTLNLLQVGEIHFGFLWDALLRLKFVVNHAGIDGIELYSPRRQVGWVKPPEPPQSQAPSNQKSSLDSIEHSVAAQVKSGTNTDSLGGLAQLLKGT